MSIASISGAVAFVLLFGASKYSCAETVSYINGHWFDGVSFQSRDLTVRNGTIINNVPGVRTVDLHGAYVLAGLGEAHNHNLQNCRMASQMAQGYVQRGILYSAQLFATDPSLSDCVKQFDSPSFPSTAFARIGVTSRTGHPIGIARAGARQAGMKMSFDQLTEGMLIADTVDELQRKWQRFASTKTDFVKVILIDAAHANRNAKQPELDGFNGVTPEVLAALIPLARAAGLRIVAHVDTAADFRIAVNNGVDTIAHLPGYRIAEGHRISDYRLSDDMARKAADKGVTVIPTMSASSYYLQAHPKNMKQIAKNYSHNLRLLRQHGVRMLTGSDRFEGSVLDEINALARTGIFSTAELVNMSSVATPEWMFLHRRVGCLNTGCEGTFNVYESNPLENLARLSAPSIVVNRGVIVLRDRHPVATGQQ
jgi:hypothetical protein